MSFFFNLQEIDHHHHHLHHQYQTDHDEHDHMDSGGSTGIRSYDCVFCQRGFTTAQALGGHMNIHRKDRANPTTNKPSPTKEPTTANYNNNDAIFSNKEILLEDDYHVDVANTRLFYSSKNFLSSQDHLNNGNSSSFEGRVHRFLGDHSPSLRGGSGHMLGKRIQDHDHSQGEEELDLELRLGHYSW